MERMNCNQCNQPTMHQTENFSGNSIHGGPKCLVCGIVEYPIEVLEAIQEIEAFDLRMSHGG